MAENVTGEQGRMTERHESVLAWIKERGCRGLGREDIGRVRVIHALVASIVSGDTVCVKRSEIERALFAMQTGADDETVLYGWLTRPATQEDTKAMSDTFLSCGFCEACVNGDPRRCFHKPERIVAASLSEAAAKNTSEWLQSLREATRELIEAAERVVKVVGRDTDAVEALKDAIAIADAELRREPE